MAVCDGWRPPGAGWLAGWLAGFQRTDYQIELAHSGSSRTPRRPRGLKALCKTFVLAAHLDAGRKLAAHSSFPPTVRLISFVRLSSTEPQTGAQARSTKQMIARLAGRAFRGNISIGPDRPLTLAGRKQVAGREPLKWPTRPATCVSGRPST